MSLKAITLILSVISLLLGPLLFIFIATAWPSVSMQGWIAGTFLLAFVFVIPKLSIRAKIVLWCLASTGLALTNIYAGHIFSVMLPLLTAMYLGMEYQENPFKTWALLLFSGTIFSCLWASNMTLPSMYLALLINSVFDPSILTSQVLQMPLPFYISHLMLSVGLVLPSVAIVFGFHGYKKHLTNKRYPTHTARLL